MQALIKKRGVVKSKLTRAVKNVDEFLSGQAAVKVWLDNVSKIEQEFEEIQVQIESMAEAPADGEADQQEIERATFERALMELKIKLQQKFDEFTSTSTTQPSNTESAAGPRHSAPRVKLQKIDLPMFSGDWREWPSFYQLFNKLIHEEEVYPPVEKFLQLSRHLDGPAKRVLDGVELIEANYEDTLDELRRRYENPRLIVNKHLKTLFELPTANNDAQLRPLVDSLQQTLRVLSAQLSRSELFDAMMVYLVGTRLTPGIRRQWEITHDDSRQLPTLDDFSHFLEQRATSAEVIAATTTSTEKRPPATAATTSSKSNSADFKGKREVKFSHITTQTTCGICKENHYTFICQKYNDSSVAERERLVTKHRLCRNCLHPKHSTASCRSSQKCKKCDQAHHTSLHTDINASSPPLNPSASTFIGLTAQPTTPTFLPTAIVYATHSTRKTLARMVIDSASQCTLITDRLAQRLKLKPTRVSVNMEGIGGTHATAPQFAVQLTIKSRHLPYELDITAKILPVITHYLPQINISLQKLIRQPGVPLADEFNDDSPIDLLLGAEYWAKIMQPGKLELSPDTSPLLNSSFGWLVSGNLTTPPSISPLTESCCFTLDEQLRQFWELEDIVTVAQSRAKKLTPEERICEEIFDKTTSRDETGRYVVKLPFNERLSELGNSNHIAERQFRQIEQRMLRDRTYREKYHAFMREYEELGHMTQVTPDDEAPHYYVPHHAVTRPDDPSKFRVVFNASQPTTTGVSLNDTVLVGETMQNTLFTILIRFRRHIVALITDAEKMYRQVLVHPTHRRFQRIKWRYAPSDQLRVYELNTVTYGYSCSPYLAIRSTKQLVLDEGANFPLAATALLFDGYIDDVITGTESIQRARRLITELQALTASGQFHLRKWASNKPEVLADINEVAPSKQYSFDKDAQFSKVLGMLWDTEADVLVFHADLPAVDGELTKRKLLSNLSRIFDPLGLLAPVVIVAKCLLQKLWLQPVGWDSVLDKNIQRAYDEYRFATNTHLHKIRIPRHVDTSPRVSFTLHGFSDASEDAYACCIYLNVGLDSGQSISHLLCAKTRVAPIKAVSVPRLELCGAVLLARAMTTIATTYSCASEQRFAYSDSTVVLSWLSKPPRVWKTFVSNRVSEITELLPSSQWRHVRSQYNSADVASRGTTAEKLVHCTLWWNPSLPPPVSSIDSNAPQSREVLKEQRKPTTVSLAVTNVSSEISALTNNYSSHMKMVRVLSLVLRAIQRFKARGHHSNVNIHRLPLAKRAAMVPESTTTQLSASHDLLIRNLQEAAYPETFARLRSNRALKKRDPLRNLTPFIDQNGLLRIRGRLSSKTNHIKVPTIPILLPRKAHFTTVLIRDTHIANLHAGPNQLNAILRQQYWIINARDAIRRVTRKCVTCRRIQAAPIVQQPTGDLPDSRTTPSRPFSIVGVDYGGPILVRYSLARKSTSTKAYIALFVCFTTKAIHLEVVSDLTTAAFLMALERFISRRGRPSEIHSDNGTNFVGASQKLTEWSEFLKNSENQVLRHLAEQQIQWHFIPPYSPNFGGLWEAGMKSAKRHLIAAMKSQLLTFEEVSTILTQAEACLNSRPLTHLSSDPQDNLLTPGHFLIGESLKASPMTTAALERITLPKRWRMVQEAAQTFWSTWSREYLAELQKRATSHTPTEIKTGEIVLLRDDNLPALQWSMGRIAEVHPGKDGIVRVVTIRTQTSSLKRPVSKLVRLPVDAD